MIVHEWYRSFSYTQIERGSGGYDRGYYGYPRDSLRRDKMLKSYPPHYPPRNSPRTIRVTADQEAVLQEQFNRWPKALHTADVVLLAAETGLSEADVQDWYAIRLAQWRKEQGLGGSLGLH